jgi:hypothetical protein
MGARRSRGARPQSKVTPPSRPLGGACRTRVSVSLVRLTAAEAPIRAGSPAPPVHVIANLAEGRGTSRTFRGSGETSHET